MGDAVPAPSPPTSPRSSSPGSRQLPLQRSSRPGRGGDPPQAPRAPDLPPPPDELVAASEWCRWWWIVAASLAVLPDGGGVLTWTVGSPDGGPETWCARAFVDAGT